MWKWAKMRAMTQEAKRARRESGPKILRNASRRGPTVKYLAKMRQKRQVVR